MTPDEFDYEEAIAVLRDWEGRTVLVVAFVEPGFSLRPFAGILSLEDAGHATIRATVSPGPDTEPMRIALPKATFHAAEWVRGMEERGLSIEQGATRVDVFLED